MKNHKIATVLLSASLLAGSLTPLMNYSNKSSVIQAATKENKSVKVRLIHDASIYNNKGKRVSKKTIIKKGLIVKTKGLRKIKGKKYYQIGKNTYIKANVTTLNIKNNVTKKNENNTQTNNIPTQGNNTSTSISLTGDNTTTHFDMDGNELGVSYIPNVPYENYSKQLTLQILQPNSFSNPDQTYPCVVFVQGSAWHKQNVYSHLANLTRLASKGYVIAIVQYRDSDADYHFLTPIIDAKNAVRFMKANADKYHVQKDNFIMMGDSSGGQVATVAGMTAKTAKFDQPINNENAEVKGIIDLYGVVDLNMDGGFPSTGDSHTINTPEGAEMGFNIREHEQETEKANSKNYVNEDFPAMLIAHGTADTTVSDKESIELYNALKKANKPVHLYLINGATHGNNAFYDQRMTDIYDQFIKQCLNK